MKSITTRMEAIITTTASWLDTNSNQIRIDRPQLYTQFNYEHPNASNLYEFGVNHI